MSSRNLLLKQYLTLICLFKQVLSVELPTATQRKKKRLKHWENFELPCLAKNVAGLQTSMRMRLMILCPGYKHFFQAWTEGPTQGYDVLRHMYQHFFLSKYISTFYSAATYTFLITLLFIKEHCINTRIILLFIWNHLTFQLYTKLKLIQFWFLLGWFTTLE